ncbi:hypothetical protein QBC35DRAFT_526198 [Podospora australis]|uniref:FAD-binding PCMH-type domain-containing protein n=1 Tax=Podospora australis TaxID=1536484 RepID=A0AAN6WJJ3_9PEZI|nr:hypothetical protein QBC35DRAFT_526198 [Podospora australis]
MAVVRHIMMILKGADYLRHCPPRPPDCPPYEPPILLPTDIGKFPALAFGDYAKAPSQYDGPRCKVNPQDPDWPTDAEWAQLNTTIHGRLLKPTPAPAVCYPGPQYNATVCQFLQTEARGTRFWLNDPLSVLWTWTQGNTCLAVANSTGKSCTQGGFPTYVVNATKDRHVQAAVNFARNKNLRLIIKNTGHDFLGRSNGYGSLSIWTHHMKNFTYLPNIKLFNWNGPVVKIEAGVETWELNNAMIAQNFTVAVPKLPAETVGVAGGWVQGGGHSNLASLYGLGADQVLRFGVVTADGRYTQADEAYDSDLFYALRGGGGTTYGVVVWAIFKAYPGRTILGTATYGFTTGPNPPSTLQIPTVNVSNIEIFWRGVHQYISFAKKITEAGGFGHGDVSPHGNSSFSFAGTFLMPGLSAAETLVFISPLFITFREIGINISTPIPKEVPYAEPSTGINTAPGRSTFSSRLLPRRNWDNATILVETTAVLRKVVERGLTLRTRAYAPNLEVAGYPGNTSAVSPHMRNMIIHTTVFSPVDVPSLSTSQFKAALDELEQGVELIRQITPGSGAYFNEAGRLEPNWQGSFFGAENYARLLKIKKKVDPWGLFWAALTVGSESWAVGTADGLPTGNGPLCRTGVVP